MRPSLLLFVALLLLPALSASAKSVHRIRASASRDFAYIINTGNAQIAGYRVYVGANGRLSSVYLMRGGRRGVQRKGSLTPLVARRFFRDLAQAAPVNALPFATRPETVQPMDAPGIRIYVLYHNHQSPDLRQSASSAGEALYQDVKQAIQTVRLPVPNEP